jgi:uracil phosphoribosyltransferase
VERATILDKAISGALEGSLANMGGLKNYSRADLDKVMKEQKLQQSGLFDDKTLVKVGKLAGVKYIVTGSIDSVTSLSFAIDKVKEHNPKSIIALTVISAPEGIERLKKEHSDITLVTAKIDEKLNENWYIVPGLGDMGDRLFGTT